MAEGDTGAAGGQGAAGTGEAGAGAPAEGAGGGRPDPQPDAAYSAKWTEHIPTDLSEAALFREKLNGKGLGEVLRKAHELDTEVGRRIPADKALVVPTTDDDAAWEKIGIALRPKEATEYTFTPDAALGWDDESTGQVKQVLWQAGVSNQSANKIVSFMAEQRVAQLDAEAKATEEQVRQDEASLRETFGADYEQRVELAQRIQSEFGLTDYLKQLGMAMDPKLTPVLAALGALTQEGGLRLPRGGQTNGGLMAGSSVEAIQAKIDEVRNSDLWKQGDPEAVKRIGRLTEERVAAAEKAQRTFAGVGR